jgi:hypothetical protein
MSQGFVETLVAQHAAGTLFNTYTTAKTVIPATSLITLPPNYIKIGTSFEIDVRGGLSNVVTTPGTVTMQVMLGSIVVFTTGAIQMNATAHTLLPFHLRAHLTCRAVGSSTSANFMGMATLSGIQFTLTAGQTDAANTGGVFSAPATAPAVGTGFDSTIANVLDFWTGFSISDAGNGIQVQEYYVKSLN